ncbi:MULTISPECIES: TIGR04104 family putative zinc finger protein [Priestia]|nr:MULTISPECIES: TIGR04104 family putative zinc finger protein [Priestia]MED5244813.1 TIGR04104 family putative zinc finger protein [Priestia sp. LL-8]
MPMATCQNCNHKWNWRTTFKQLLTFRNVLECPHCDKQQYISAKSQKRLSIYSFAPLIIWLILSLLDFSFPSIVVAELIFFIAAVIMMPLSYEVSSEEEPLW